MNPIKEQTNNRPSNYSKWHRPPNLPNWCLLADGDWFEMRETGESIEPVACIETMEIGGLFIKQAQQNYPLWKTKKYLLKEIQLRMNIPVYIVRHTSDCHLFAISRLTQDGDETSQLIYDENQYKKFLIEIQNGGK